MNMATALKVFWNFTHGLISLKECESILNELGYDYDYVANEYDKTRQSVYK